MNEAEEFWEEENPSFFSSRKWKVTLAVTGILSLSLLAGVFYFVFTLSQSLPDAKTLITHQNSEPTVILSREGLKIGELYEERRYPRKLQEINPLLIKCFLAAEDARFYEHHGVDWIGFSRAFFHFVTLSSSKQGGSTLTQQLAKGLLLSNERTLQRKLKDILLSFRIEKEMTKEQILELYLNTLYLGNQSYGVEAAAVNYFRKHNKNLNLAETSMIAGLAPAPSAYAPNTHLQLAKVRQKFVLEQMQKQGWATAQEVEKALAEPLKIYDASNPNTRIAPYFFIEIKKILEETLKIPNLTTSGYRVHTTLDVAIQKVANKAVSEGLKEFENKKSFKGPIKRFAKNFSSRLKEIIDTKPEENATKTRAIVVDLIPGLDAAAVVTERGLGILDVQDHRWALKPVSQGNNRTVLDFADVLKIGDEIHVAKSKRSFPLSRYQRNESFKSFQKYEELFSAGSEDLSYFVLTDVEGIEGSAIAMEAATGNVLAMVGGESFERSQFNRATQAKRQVGSSVKPLYYSLALSNGFSLASKIDTPPLVIGDWKPENYNKEFTGRTTLRTSLVQSYNISSIQLYQALGSANISKHFAKFGFHWPSSDLSVSLGSGSATLLQMVQAYSPFAHGGRIQTARYITKIEDRNGQIVFESKVKELKIEPVPETKILSPAAAFVTTRLMQDVVRFGTGTGAAGVPFASGKTGTSNAYRDAWFLGVTPHLVGGVWVGFDDPQKSMGAEGTGGRMAAPIWREFMKEAAKRDLELHPANGGDYVEPPGVSYVNVDLASGDVVSSGTRIPVVVGSEPGTAGARNALGIMGSGESGSDSRNSQGSEQGTDSSSNSDTDLGTLRGLQ